MEEKNKTENKTENKILTEEDIYHENKKVIYVVSILKCLF